MLGDVRGAPDGLATGAWRDLSAPAREVLSGATRLRREELGLAKEATWGNAERVREAAERLHRDVHLTALDLPDALDGEAGGRLELLLGHLRGAHPAHVRSEAGEDVGAGGARHSSRVPREQRLKQRTLLLGLCTLPRRLIGERVEAIGPVPTGESLSRWPPLA